MPCIIKSKCQYFIKHFNKCLSNTKSCYHSRNVRNKRLKKKNPVCLMDAPSSSPVTLYQMRRVRILQPCGGHFLYKLKEPFWPVSEQGLNLTVSISILWRDHLQGTYYGQSTPLLHCKNKAMAVLSTVITKKANCNNLKCYAMKLVPWKLNRKLLLFPIVWGRNSVLYYVGHFDLRPFALQKLAILKLVTNFNQVHLCS